MTQVSTPAVIPSNPKDKEAIFNAIKEASNSMTRIDAEKDQLKAIAETMKEKYNLDKKLFNRMAKTYHKQSFSKEEQSTKDFIDMYEAIVK